MAENWSATNKAAGAGAARIWTCSPGLWIAGAVILLAGILAVQARPDHATRRRHVAAAFGGANTFYGSPRVNRDGSQFTYVAITDARGCALYLRDTSAKQARQIAFEEDGLGDWHDTYEMRAWPWAPDDSAFVYTMRDKLAVYPLDASKQPAEMTVRTNAVSQVAWLTPSRFVFIQSASNLCCARQEENGQWQYQYCHFPSDNDFTNITSLTVISTNTVAWLKGGLIYRLDLDKSMSERQQTQTTNVVSVAEGAIMLQNPLAWVEIKGATDMAYSRATGQLLLRVEDGPQKTFWLCDSKGALTKVMQANSAPGAQWAGPDSFAYMTAVATHNQIVVADVHGTEKSRLSKGGNIRSFTLAPTSGRMLFVGIVSNEPSHGIWQYDPRTGELQAMVSYSTHPFPEAKGVPAFRSRIGTEWAPITYMVYPPPEVKRGKKYPLVISDTVTLDAIHGPMFQSGIAGAGAYVAIVERVYWPTFIEQWATNVMNLYEELKQDPTVDLRRVYLFAASAETRYLSELVERTPGPWRGVILLNPGQLPDFSKAPRYQPRPRILICAGGKEQEEERFKQYQQNALKEGVLVDYIIGASETHRYVGTTAKRERAEAVEHFIFEE